MLMVKNVQVNEQAELQKRKLSLPRIQETKQTQPSNSQTRREGGCENNILGTQIHMHKYLSNLTSVDLGIGKSINYQEYKKLK
jgi:ABC-type phosphate transport system permease subunit